MIPLDNLSIKKGGNGDFAIDSSLFSLASDRISVKLLDKKEIKFRFNSSYDKKATIGDIQGVIEGDISNTQGIEVKREFFRSTDKRYVALRLIVRNTTNTEIQLDSVTPIHVHDDKSLVVGGVGLSDWRILRLPRLKSDIPSYFKFNTIDENYEDSIFLSVLNRVAGLGVTVKGKIKTDVREVHSGPGMIIRNDMDRDVPGLFVGMLGQTNHLSDIVISSTKDRNHLENFKITCEFDGISLDVNEEIATHWIVFYTHVDEGALLNNYAELLACISGLKPLSNPLTVYCSWYFYVREFNQRDLEENLNFITKHSMPIDVFIIDNGWMDDFGLYNANHLFPDGMEHAANLIREAGMRPGIWTPPFVVNSKSPILEKYPELPSFNRHGNPVMFKNVDGDSHVIDPTTPAAKDYVYEVYEKIKKWGFTFHKLDYLRCIVSDKDIVFRNPKVNRAMAYRLLLSYVREALGDDQYILGCGGVTDAANVGILDGYRTSRDMRGRWHVPDSHRIQGAVTVMKQNLLRSYTNRLWHIDPDASMIRLRSEPYKQNEEKRIAVYLSEGHFTDEEAFTVLAHQYVSGGNICISENLEELQESRLKLFRHIVPVAAPPAKILDYDHAQSPSLFLTHITPQCKSLGTWWTLCIANWEDEHETRTISLETLPLSDKPESFAIFEFRTQTFMGIKKATDSIDVEVPAHSMRVLRLAPWNNSPLILGTDLHITGGACEIVTCSSDAFCIKGRIQTQWQYPVHITAGFPGKNDHVYTRGIRLEPGEQDFSIQSQ